jgi:hypothetical protein
MNNNKVLYGLKYSIYLSFHPFKGFWELKKEGVGDTRVATMFLTAMVLINLLSKQYTSYLYRTAAVSEVNIAREIFTVLGLFFCWCLANWCLTTLFDGEGTLKDVYIATSYAMVPYTVTTILMIPLSYVFSINEASFYNTVIGIALIWTALLILCSVLVTHQYTFGKTLLMIGCIILCMCMFAYIFLLFFNLIQQIMGFIVNVYKELSLRVN